MPIYEHSKPFNQMTLHFRLDLVLDLIGHAQWTLQEHLQRRIDAVVVANVTQQHVEGCIVLLKCTASLLLFGCIDCYWIYARQVTLVYDYTYDQ